MWKPTRPRITFVGASSSLPLAMGTSASIMKYVGSAFGRIFQATFSSIVPSAKLVPVEVHSASEYHTE